MSSSSKTNVYGGRVIVAPTQGFKVESFCKVYYNYFTRKEDHLAPPDGASRLYSLTESMYRACDIGWGGQITS